MKAEALLALYERVADAPDAVTRLRRFVLDLAVRGKVTERQLRRNEVVVLGDVAEFVMGQAPPGHTCNSDGDGTLFVKVGEFGQRYPEAKAWTTNPLKMARKGDVLICVVGATVGKLNLGVDCAIGRSVAAIRPAPELDVEYLYVSLMPFTMTLRETARGSAQGVISRKDLEGIQIWVPPLAEQHRIVAKVDELMALLDRLDAARSAREATRDRLTTASLTRLTAPDTDPETLRTHARFALDALPALTTRADQIKQLRRTVLDLAVRGRLSMPSNSAEGELQTELSVGQLSRAVKQASAASQISEVNPQSKEHGAYQLPPSWCWSSASDACESIESGSTPPSSEMFEGKGDVPFIKVYNLTRTGALDFNVRPTFVSLQTHQGRLARSKIRPNDVLMNIVGPPLGKVSVVPDTYPEWNTNQAVVRFRPGPVLTTRYLAVCLLSEPVLGWLTDLAQQTVGQVNISVRKCRRLPIPLPPLAEQHRIVAKVDELMALCDRLEAALQAIDTSRARLLEALLHEALAGREPQAEAA